MGEAGAYVFLYRGFFKQIVGASLWAIGWSTHPHP